MTNSEEEAFLYLHFTLCGISITEPMFEISNVDISTLGFLKEYTDELLSFAVYMSKEIFLTIFIKVQWI